jgi:hypothetical protein
MEAASPTGDTDVNKYERRLFAKLSRRHRRRKLRGLDLAVYRIYLSLKQEGKGRDPYDYP